MADSAFACSQCKKTGSAAPNLKRCAKCRWTWYCGRECQKADWKWHKKVCSTNAFSNAPPSFDPSRIEHNTNYRTPEVKNLDVQIAKPFTALDNGTFLHDRSEKDVYKLLIDCFRMRQEDNCNLEGDIDEDSIYGGASNSLPGFKRFLRLASSRPGLLPPWWDESKQAEVLKLGMKGVRSQWSSLEACVEKADIIEQYGDPRMPMQLRLLGETVYQRGPGGQDGTAMKHLIVMMEANKGRDGEQVMSIMPI